MYFKKTQLMLTKATVPGSVTGSRERRIRALALLPVSSVSCRKKKLMASGELQLGFISASLGTFSQVP